MKPAKTSLGVISSIILVAFGVFVAFRYPKPEGDTGARAREMIERLQSLENERQALKDRVRDLESQLQPAPSATSETKERTAKEFKLQRAIAQLRQENERLSAEAEKIRGGALDQILSSAVDSILRRFEDSPEQKIPELSLLSREDLLRIVRQSGSADSSDTTLAKIRTEAKLKTSRILTETLLDYMSSHNGNSPAIASELAPYLKGNIDSSVLDRYNVLSNSLGNLSNPSAMVLVEKLPGISSNDTMHWVGPWSSGYGIPQLPPAANTP